MKGTGYWGRLAHWAARGCACTLTLTLACSQGATEQNGGVTEPQVEHPIYVPGAWVPGEVLPGPEHPRGLLDLRGAIHAHSVYSSDACDNGSRDEDTGAINEDCFADFRNDLCAVGHDFVMLTDHTNSFSTSEFPDVLLYRPERGDELVEREGSPVANWAGCPDGTRALILAGAESGNMPVGLERHPEGTTGDRNFAYGTVSPEAIEILKANGAVTLVAHTEDWTAEQLVELPLDGFEMYNLHANIFARMGDAIKMFVDMDKPGQTHPDLFIIPILEEDPHYADTWGTVLARGARRATIMATDCHQNAVRTKLEDGRRGDSYRRMLLWLSNHLLVRPDTEGKWNDRDLKDALRSGRLYGAFEIFGYPRGFDFHAVEGGDADNILEMGEEASAAKSVVLKATLPTLANLSPKAPPPTLTLRILRAREGGWDLIHTGNEDVSLPVTEPGAYRAEVRIVPAHLAGYLGMYADALQADYPYIYSNPIYLVP